MAEASCLLSCPLGLSLPPLRVAFLPALGHWGPFPHQVFIQPTLLRFLTHHEGPPGHTYESLLWSMCPNSVHTFCHPLPLLFCAPGTMGRARVVLGPCFRVGLECICALVCLNLLPARCLCASLWFQARWYCPPPGKPPPETPEAAGAGAVLPSHSSRGRRRFAEKLRCSHAAGGGRTWDFKRPRWAGCEPSAASKYFISSRKGN